MTNKDEIYNYQGRIDGVLKRINSSDFCEEDKQIFNEYHRECIILCLSKGRIAKYLNTLKRIRVMLGKPFKQVTKDDVRNLILTIESRNLSDWTKHDYKIIFKIFFRWLKQTEDYPDEVSWITSKIRNSRLLPEEILTEEEVERLVDSAYTIRDKAFILVLYESGCRIGELLSLSLKNVQFDEYGAKLIVDGKTGMRRVRIIFSAPKLALWIDNHPLRENPDAPLWITQSMNRRNRQLMYSSAKTMLKKIAKKSGIKKRIYPHLFRHSRATHLSKHLTESQLKHHLGWVQASKMASIYVHLSGRDVDQALLNLQGIKSDIIKEKPKMVLQICSRCENENSPSSKFCNKCGSPLNIKKALEIDEARKKADQILSKLVRKPKVMEVLLKTIDDLENPNIR